MNKKKLMVLILALGVLMGLPVAALSGSLLYGCICGVTTILMLDIAMIRPYPPKVKLVFIAIYTLSMIAVIVWLITL